MNDKLYLKQVQNFSKNVKYLRNKRGLTIAEFAKLIDIPKGTVSVYECGYNLASEERIQKIADFYGIENYMDLLMTLIEEA